MKKVTPVKKHASSNVRNYSKSELIIMGIFEKILIFIGKSELHIE